MSIEIKTSATPAMLITAARYAITGLGGFIVAKGWLTTDQMAQIGGVVLTTVIPLAWGVYSTWKNKADIIIAAGTDPANVTLK